MSRDDMNYEEVFKFREALPKGFSLSVTRQVSFSEGFGWERHFAASAYGYRKRVYINVCKAGKTIKEACDAVLSELKEEIPND